MHDDRNIRARSISGHVKRIFRAWLGARMTVSVKVHLDKQIDGQIAQGRTRGRDQDGVLVNADRKISAAAADQPALPKFTAVADTLLRERYMPAGCQMVFISQ